MYQGVVNRKAKAKACRPKACPLKNISLLRKEVAAGRDSLAQSSVVTRSIFHFLYFKPCRRHTVIYQYPDAEGLPGENGPD